MKMYIIPVQVNTQSKFGRQAPNMADQPMSPLSITSMPPAEDRRSVAEARRLKLLARGRDRLNKITLGQETGVFEQH